LEMLSRERGLPVALHKFLNELKQVYTMEIIATRCRPTFHHQYALSQLRQRGYRMSVCSNSVRATIELMMQKSALMQYLEFIMSNQDVVHGKPDPEIYNKAIARMGLRPQECLVVEDNPNGVAAVRAAGARLLEVSSVEEVNWNNIQATIKRCEVAEYA